MKARKPCFPRLENGARLSPVEIQVVRKIEREEDRERLAEALKTLVAKDGPVWTSVMLAVAAGVSMRTVENVMVRYGVVAPEVVYGKADQSTVQEV
jgi:hypothetical protein